MSLLLGLLLGIEGREVAHVLGGHVDEHDRLLLEGQNSDALMICRLRGTGAGADVTERGARAEHR